MTIPTGQLLLAQIPAAVNPPAAAPAAYAGTLQVWTTPPGDVGALTPVGLLPVYHADLSGPVLPAGSPVVLSLSQGGTLYVSAAGGYVGKSPSAIAGQSGFTGF